MGRGATRIGGADRGRRGGDGNRRQNISDLFMDKMKLEVSLVNGGRNPNLIALPLFQQESLGDVEISEPEGTGRCPCCARTPQWPRARAAQRARSQKNGATGLGAILRYDAYQRTMSTTIAQ